MKLRTYLKELEPSGVVNAAIFGALDRFDEELSGRPADERLREVVPELIAMLPEYGTEITAFCHLEHHHGGEVNVNQCNMMGYFCKADALVPEEYDFYDVPTEHAAYAVYSSPVFDGNYFDAAYEFTRDQILGDNVHIPYPQAYWTAEVYLEGFFTGNMSEAYSYYGGSTILSYQYKSKPMMSIWLDGLWIEPHLEQKQWIRKIHVRIFGSPRLEYQQNIEKYGEDFVKYFRRHLNYCGCCNPDHVKNPGGIRQVLGKNVRICSDPRGDISN